MLRLAAGEVADLERDRRRARRRRALAAAARRWRWSAAPASGSSGCPSRAPHAVVLLPGGGGLGTAEVFAEADRLGLGRQAEELDELAERLRAAAGAGASPLAYAELLVNDLEPAARSLRPGDRRGARRAARRGRARSRC